MIANTMYWLLVSTKGKEIVVKKRFNGQMKWPCILRYDTIPLGRLNQGNYMSNPADH